MELTSLLRLFEGQNSPFSIDIPPSWHQGRTAYGGLSTVLAYAAASKSAEDLPPLQSAQIAFAGPLSGKVDITASVLRRGRNTAFIKSEISSQGQTGLSCTFIFMQQRESKLDFLGLDQPDFPPIPTAEQTRSGSPEFFTGHMQYPDKRLDLSIATTRLANWHRLSVRGGLDPIAELLCIGDALPPSAMGLMKEAAMVSSMNWQVNLLTPSPATKDGWWFLESETHHAANGASSQYMTVWNTAGQPVMIGMQSVAIFG
jgi:acyl-CoA thioesterase